MGSLGPLQHHMHIAESKKRNANPSARQSWTWPGREGVLGPCHIHEVLQRLHLPTRLCVGRMGKIWHLFEDLWQRWEIPRTQENSREKWRQRLRGTDHEYGAVQHLEMPGELQVVIVGCLDAMHEDLWHGVFPPFPQLRPEALEWWRPLRRSSHGND